MRKTIEIPIGESIPSVSSVLKSQGIPINAANKRAIGIAEEALKIYGELLQPKGILLEISKADFGHVYYGKGFNDSDAPVKTIYEKSNHLALFLITIGEAVCEEISRLFAIHDYAIGSMLDTAASEGAEMAAQFVEGYFRRDLTVTRKFNSHDAVLRFSPGYCGWHISGQGKLFEYLKPEDIGVSLNESFLMQPLKSISGVIICGEKDIFDFRDDFIFCSDCTTHECRERFAELMKQNIS
jgi:hypothetical protein